MFFPVDSVPRAVPLLVRLLSVQTEPSGRQDPAHHRAAPAAGQDRRETATGGGEGAQGKGRSWWENRS